MGEVTALEVGGVPRVGGTVLKRMGRGEVLARA